MCTESQTRRRLLRPGGVAVAAGVSGCLRLAESNSERPDSRADSNDSNSNGDAEPPEAENETETQTETVTGVGGGAGIGGARFPPPLERGFPDRVNDISGDPEPAGLRFVEDRRGTVLELDGDSADDDQGYYTFSYDEIGDYVSRGDTMTIVLWMKPLENQGWERAIALDPVIDLRYGYLRFRRWNPDENGNEFLIRRNVDTQAPNPEWTDLVGTVEIDGEARLYVDGSRVGAASTEGLSETLGGSSSRAIRSPSAPSIPGRTARTTRTSAAASTTTACRGER